MNRKERRVARKAKRNKIPCSVCGKNTYGDDKALFVAVSWDAPNLQMTLAQQQFLKKHPPKIDGQLAVVCGTCVEEGKLPDNPQWKLDKQFYPILVNPVESEA